MRSEFASETPTKAYKQIIELLVRETSRGVSKRLVREEGRHFKAPDRDDGNQLVRLLATEDRKILADMLHEECTSIIHDVLARLTSWMDCRQVALVS